VRIASVVSTFPEHYYPQEEILSVLMKQWAGAGVDRQLERFHEHVAVRGRHLAVEKERYADLSSFTARNAEYKRVAAELGERALAQALREAEVEAKDLDHIFFVSITGMTTPSIDALLVNRLGLNPHIKRTPIFGLGCVAGAAGLARAADYLRAFPKHNVALVAVELCSLTWQARDRSVANLIASSLFGDGAAAVVLSGSEHRALGPRVLASRSVLYPETEDVMGWTIGSEGLKIQLAPGVPDLVRQHIAGDVDQFLNDHGLDRSRVDHWILHTGGPRVLKAFEAALDLPDGALALSWESLRDKGNLSSVSVLLVLQATWRQKRPKAGSHSLLLAMGPGFCSELVLLQW